MAIRKVLWLSLALALNMEAAWGEESLAASIEALGTWETETTRHELTLDGCDLTISFWKDWNTYPKALHSIHSFDLVGYVPLDARHSQRDAGWFQLGGGDVFGEVLMIEMKSHDYLLSELAMRSEPDPPFEISTRKDLDTFVLKRRIFHGLRFDGLRENRMERLARLLDRYFLENCSGAS